MRSAIVKFLAIPFAASLAIASQIGAQGTPAFALPPFWTDTTGESPVYPVGEAVPVYRAVLDLLYHDGNRRPRVIIMWDTAERRSSGPCPIAKCYGSKWAHKSKIDTATVMAFAQVSPKRPGIRDFGYPIPIVLISQDDIQRMMADGNEILADRPRLGNEGMMAGFYAELTRKYPGAWGVTIMSKVGFNLRRDEALIGVHHWCGDGCRSVENIFLKKEGGRWRVVERIPSDVDIEVPSRVLRYVGPAGTNEQESEVLVPDSRSGAPPEATARAAVYRVVIDSLYSFYGEHPKTIVLTDFFWPPFDSVPKRPAIDQSLATKFSVLRRARAPFDTRPSYRVPMVWLPMDSFPSLRVRGVSLDKAKQTGYPQDLAFAQRYPGAWGMLSMSRVAFNTDRSTALVFTMHSCGEHCRTSDTWLLQRTGSQWHIVERIPSESEKDFQIEPLRYVGLDARPEAYRRRRVQGVVTDYTTGKPIPFLDIDVVRVLNSGAQVSDPSLRTDSAGHYTLTNLPLYSSLSLRVQCLDAPRGAAIQSFGVMPGMDTTINFQVDFSVCEPVVEAPQPSALSGAEAFIAKDSARFVFPLAQTESYMWDIPSQRAYPDFAQYMWVVQWEIPDSRAGKTPYMLWLIKEWQPGGPRTGPLQKLIAGVPLEAMIDCMTCSDIGVLVDPETDHFRVFATVENGQLIFIVRGADAVRRIFPSIPSTVTFSQSIQLPGPEGPGRFSASQEVLVNCRKSDESAEAKRRCDVK